ncbi:MAG: CoA transferase [Candidatus Rokubacteria bacterium]|nr:CoA transferase [Candidatus Rokubacteria bacterium]
MSYAAPFAGLRVVDLSQGIAGPYCAMLLAQHGADVIKVEPPAGDWSRTLGARYGDQTAFSIAANLGKRSIALDLKEERSRLIVRRLIERADVFFESYRPGVAARLGLGYEALSTLNPRILYVSVSGFGQTGPERERPAVDTTLQAFTGLISVNTGDDGTPHRVGAVVVDMSTALFTFQAVSAALYARTAEPRGRYLQASLMQAGAALQTVNMIANHLEGGVAQPGLTPSGTFPAMDGWLNVTVLRNEEFPALCDAIERPDLKADPRFADNDARFRHVATLTEALAETFRRRPAAEWGERLRAAGIMHERVNTHLDYLRHPHVEASGTVVWLDQPGVGRVPVPWPPGLTPPADGTRRAIAPSLDEHGKEILAELGLSA